MSTQRHVIKRQVLEFHVAHAADAKSLQAEVSRIYRQRIVPLIDRYCTDLSAPDLIHRIDKLELNLGRIDPRHLEERLVAQVSGALKALLAEQIQRRERRTETASRLELFTLFVRTGNLPWWADSSQPDLLDRCLQNLIRTAPSLLRQALRESAKEERHLRRIVQHLSGERLTELVQTLNPAFEAASFVSHTQDLLAALQRIGIVASDREVRLRTLVWSVALQRAIANTPEEPMGASLHRAILARAAREMGIPYSALVSHITIDADAAAAPVRSIAGRKLAQSFRLLRMLAGRLPSESRAQMQATIDRLELRSADTDVIEELVQFLRAETGRQLAGGTSRGKISKITQFLHTLMSERKERPSAVELSPADSGGELYIDNAGLVLLGPFLRYFFSRLELLSPHDQFKDPSARQRAAGLLQYAVTEDPSPPPEYLLPLNKLLCGMELEEVSDFGSPVDKAEAEECANLLNAVIVNAPILKDMSMSGFRRTFLQRRGVLSSRDGAWLLRVERETYDIVLDRFPWNIYWVKLPWMDSVIQIEW